MAEQGRNFIWVAVLASITVVIALGAYTFNLIRSPGTLESELNQEKPWIIDPQRPWIDRGPRDFDYGQVPFVPAKSHYSHGRVQMPHVPPVEATIPPEERQPETQEQTTTEASDEERSR